MGQRPSGCFHPSISTIVFKRGGQEGPGQERRSRHIGLVGSRENPETGLSEKRWETVDLGQNVVEGLTQS